MEATDQSVKEPSGNLKNQRRHIPIPRFALDWKKL